jgi:GNAT superfamily N-acetyltransferase
MNVRVLADDDLAPLLGLYRHLNPKDPPLDPAAAESIWRETRGSSWCQYIGGFEGHQLVSACTTTVIPNLTRAGRPYALIENVVTDAAFRGRGWGRNVLSAALQFAWARSCYKVMLLTGRKDDGIVGFYERCGFRRDDKLGFVARPAPTSVEP